jgi:hypothetical protein
MKKNIYYKIKKNNRISLKYMIGNAYAQEDVLGYKYDKKLKKQIGIIKKSINIKFTTGPWAGKKFLFRKEEIKNYYG